MDDDVTSDRPEPRPLEVRGSAILHGTIAVGEVSDGWITLNLGWARLAGLGIRILGDPEKDRKRGGIVLERPA